jgi:hypothetical protein
VVALSAAGVLSASPAAADVLVNQPAQHVCVGHSFKVGVWYQSYSGGSRKYRVRVFAPNGTKLLDRHGKAHSAHWKYWHIQATSHGTYRTKYNTPNGKPYIAKTHARSC